MFFSSLLGEISDILHSKCPKYLFCNYGNITYAYLKKHTIEINATFFVIQKQVLFFALYRIQDKQNLSLLKKMDSNIVKIIFICVTVLLLCFTILENISRTISIPDQLVHLVNYINNSVTNVSQKNRFNDGEMQRIM